MSVLDFHGAPSDRRAVEVGMIGCGSHGWRNIVPALHFTPLHLEATCDLDRSRVEAWAASTSAAGGYDDHHRMLTDADIEAVLIVTGYDDAGRPRYPDLAVDCLAAGKHVWIEKPPAATIADIDRMANAATVADRQVMVGFKKMFAPANRKARALMQRDDFGRAVLLRLEYPQRIPTVEEMRRYLGDDEAVPAAVSFLDHLCHPMSVLVLLAGAPESMRFDRSRNGAGVATFHFESGSIATLSFTWAGGFLDGLERTVITSDRGRHIVVDNNRTVEYHRLPIPGYGDIADFYTADPDEATAVWSPELSLGQLYNKGVFALGYWSELQEFADAIAERRAPSAGTLTDARTITQVFEAFATEPGDLIALT